MAPGNRLNRLRLLVSAAGLLLVNGCLAALEQSIDFVLSPEAAGNLAAVPYAGVAGLIEFLASLSRG